MVDFNAGFPTARMGREVYLATALNSMLYGCLFNPIFVRDR